MNDFVVGRQPPVWRAWASQVITAGSEMDQAIMTEYDLKKMKVGHK